MGHASELGGHVEMLESLRIYIYILFIYLFIHLFICYKKRDTVREVNKMYANYPRLIPQFTLKVSMSAK